MSDEQSKNGSAKTDVLYRFGNVQWRLGILTYEEFGKMLSIIKADLNGNLDQREVMQQTIDKWYESGQLQKLFALWLKPYGESIWRRILNRYHAWRGRVNVSDPIAKLTLEQVARVNTDFFLVNAEWMGNLILTQRSLALTLIMTTQPQPATPSAETSSSTGSVLGRS